MKITSIETVHLAEFPAVIWVQIKTDSGHVGLGETFFGPRAVAGCVHEMFAPMLIGKDPLAIERHWRDMFDMANAFGYAGAEAGPCPCPCTCVLEGGGRNARTNDLMT